MDVSYADIAATLDDLGRKVTAMREAGRSLAESEADYRQRLRVAILKERAEGTPVSIVGDVCRGIPEIALAKLRRDAADAEAKASAEAINVLKLRVRVMEAQLERDWAQAGRM